MSSFYLDVAKDRLYCGAAGAPERRATQTVLYGAARALLTVIAPILPHTADEAWQHLPKRPDDPDSIHLLRWASAPAEWAEWGQGAAGDRGRALLGLRAAAARAVEAAIAVGTVGKAAEAELTCVLPPAVHALLAPLAAELPDLLLVAGVCLEAGEGPATDVAVAPTRAPRCERCWRHRPGPAVGGLCARCADVLAGV